MSFEKIKGHQNQLKYLSRLKKSGSIPHALLFTGQQGIGKRLIADIFAASVFCKETEAPCGKCHSCMQIKAGSYPDFLVLERDDKGKIPVGASDRSQQGSVRWMIDRLTRSSINGRYVVIVDGVETISESGQNALLKTVEEPGSDSHIILIAESKSGILPTIVSRCIEINFNPLPVSDINDIVDERFPEGENSSLISSICGGSADVALRLYDDKIFDGIIAAAKEIKGILRGRGTAGKAFDFSGTAEPAFVITVLVNLYSFMVRSHITGEVVMYPDDITLDAYEAEKAVKILLAIKKGLKNNLNVNSILKGMLYSVSEINSRGFPDPDFSWLL